MTDTAVVACPSCGEPIHPGDRFCEACGHELGPPTAAGQGAGGEAGTRTNVLAVPDSARVAPTPEEVPACPACGSPAQWLDGYCGVCGARRPDPRDHLELSLPGLAAVTDRGRRHARNEDAFAAGVGSGFVAVVVCDGVSTTVRPEEASQAAADAALASLLAGDGSAPHLQPAYDAARQAVLAVPFEPRSELGPPSCTFLAATIFPDVVHLASAGDCRSYWLAGDGSVSTLTVDDSWARQELAAGRPPEEVWADRRAHSITRWLGQDADPGWRPSTSRFDPPGPGRLLLCSDGLWNYTLEESHLAVLVKEEAGRAGGLLDLARRLTQYANDAGGADNITVVLVDVAGPVRPDAAQGDDPPPDVAGPPGGTPVAP